MPSSEDEWENIGKTFDKWNFPHCVGAIDGKHIVMAAPPNSGSIFYNYKHTHSIVLMAICDGDYKFIYIDVGCNGRISDGGVFNKSSFATALGRGSLHLPEPRPLPGGNKNIPFVIVADDAFSLKTNIMKPFPGRQLSASNRIYNYRLSRARRCIENAFGVMSARFRVLLSPILLDAAKTRKVTLACCSLHNYLITRNGNEYAPIGFVDQYANNGSIIEGGWRRQLPESFLQPLQSLSNRYICDDANNVRKEFEQYFMSIEGEVPWQYNNI